MERLISRDRFPPPKGWWYRHVETGFYVSGLSFKGTVDAMQRHFKGNPQLAIGTDFDSVAWLLEQFIIASMSRDQKEGWVSDLSPVMASTHLNEPPRKCKTCGK